MEGLENDLSTEEPIVFIMDEEENESPQVTFVDDCLFAVAVAEAPTPQDEYETDSGDDFSDREDEDIAPVTVSKCGTYFVCYSLPNAPVWASAIFPDHFIAANYK